MSDQQTPEIATKHSWDSIPPEQMTPLLTRQFISGTQSMIARIVLTKGSVVPTHSHPNEQIAHILSGALEFNVAGTIHLLRAGEILVIPGNVPHSATALEDTVDIDIFAPPRQDWIDKDDSYLR